MVYKDKNKILIINRRDVILNSRYPELLNIVNNVNAHTAILDGEIVVYDEKGRPDFYRLAEREHVSQKLRIELLSRLIPATYIVFDILEKDDVKLIAKPLIQRKSILQDVVNENSEIKLCFYTTNGERLFRVTKSMGIEGIMGKERESLYYPGERKSCWLKIKHLKTLDAVICGFTTGVGRREPLGSLILGCYYRGKLRYVGKVGTGFTEDELKRLLEKLENLKTSTCPFHPEPDLKLPRVRKPVWVRPILICEVRFMNLTKELIMRAPVYRRLRNDKSPEECILEV